MYCPNCGKQIPDYSNFCSYCGGSTGMNSGSSSNFSGTPNTGSYTGFQGTPNTNNYTGFQGTPYSGTPKRPSGFFRKWMLLLIIPVALVILAIPMILLLSILSGSSSDSGSSSKSSSVSSFGTVAEIPDPEYFFGLDCSVKEKSDDNGTIIYTITSDADHGHILEEYLDLLTDDYPFRETDSEHVTENYVQIDPDDLYDYLYGLNYSGSKELRYSGYKVLESGKGYDIYIQYRGTGTRYTDGKTVEWDESTTIITIRNANQFEIVSDGKYTPPATEAPREDPVDDSEKTDDPFKRETCWTCGGDGRCNTCGGSGQVRTWTGDGSVYQRCTDAFCSSGRCNRCGGDGYK